MTSAGWNIAAAQLSLFQWYGLIAGAALCLLLLPAFAMGAGFPLVLAALGNRAAHLGRDIWFEHIRRGLRRVAAAVAVACLGLGRGGASDSRDWLAGRACVIAACIPLHRNGGLPERLQRQNVRLCLGLLAYAGIGAASLILEIAWTRLFGMVMLRTEYVLAVILAAFLLGIGLGSLIAPRQHRQAWFVALPISAGGFALLSLWLLPALSAWVERAEFASLFGALATQGLMLTLVDLCRSHWPWAPGCPC